MTARKKETLVDLDLVDLILTIVWIVAYGICQSVVAVMTKGEMKLGVAVFLVQFALPFVIGAFLIWNPRVIRMWALVYVVVAVGMLVLFLLAGPYDLKIHTPLAHAVILIGGVLLIWRSREEKSCTETELLSEEQSDAED